MSSIPSNFVVGSTASVSRLITDEIVREFAELSGILNRFTWTPIMLLRRGLVSVSRTVRCWWGWFRRCWA